MPCFDDGMWIDPAKVFAYNRHFIFINSKRGTGKTYSFQKYCLDDCLKHGHEMIQIYRRDNLRKKNQCGTYAKVLRNEFKDREYRRNAEGIEFNLGTKEAPKWTRVVHALALSTFASSKIDSFPLVKYIIFDEYIIENLSASRYVSGIKEPDALLNLYDTVDRREDRVYCIFLGNTSTFYNPYHMHKAFKINRDPGPNGVLKYKNVLYIHYTPPAAWEKRQEENAFAQMIADTDYGAYATDGVWSEDSSDFIAQRPANCSARFTLAVGMGLYGVWDDGTNYYLSEKNDPSVPVIAYDPEAHKDGSIYRGVGSELRHLSVAWSYGFLRFDNPRVKASCMPLLYTLRAGR